MFKHRLIFLLYESENMYIRHEIGKVGEKIANDYLKKQGYVIIERNFEAKQGEIDIIARKEKELVFIEVKTRTGKRYGEPVEAVNNIKQKHLIKTVEYYLYSRKLEKEYVRIDVIEIYLYKNKKYKINHIKQII